MPELFFEIKFNADQASLNTVKEQVDAIQKQSIQAQEESVKGSQQQANLEEDILKSKREKLRLLRREANVAEANFRLGVINQEQLEQTTQEIYTQAEAQELFTQEVDRSGAAQKSLVQAQLRAQSGFKGIAQTSARANQSLMNLGRIVQDLPFGFLGISNNIDPALNSFRELKNESGGTAGALKALGGSLAGSGGIIFALGSLLPTAVLMAQKGLNFYSKSTSKATSLTKDLTESIIDFADGQESAFDLRRINRSTARSIEIANLLIARADTLSGDVADALEEEGERLKENAEVARERANTLVEYIVATTKLTEMQARNALVETELLEDRKEGVEVTREYLKLLADGVGFDREALDLKEMTIENTNELVRLADEQISRLEKVAKRDQIIFQFERERLDLLRATNRISKEEYEIRSQQITNEQIQVRQRYEEEIRGIRESKQERIDSQYEIIQAERDARRELLNNMPEREDEIFDESANLAAQAALREMQTDAQIQSFTGVEQRKAEIQADFERRRLQIIEQYGSQTNATREMLKLNEEQRQRELTKVVQTEAERQKQFKVQAAQAGLQLAGGIISSLMKLNQAQTDQTEAQARKRFETQKKLSKAQAIVNGAGAIVKTYNEYGWTPFGIAAAVAQAAATAIQLRAIEQTQFNSAGSASSSSNTRQTGFFETDASGKAQSQPAKPNMGMSEPVIILKGEFDDEMVSVKAERGSNKRRRGTQFSV